MAHMEGSASNCCGVAPRACKRAAKASFVGAKKVAVTYGEFTSSAKNASASQLKECLQDVN